MAFKKHITHGDLPRDRLHILYAKAGLSLVLQPPSRLIGIRASLGFAGSYSPRLAAFSPTNADRPRRKDVGSGKFSPASGTRIGSDCHTTALSRAGNDNMSRTCTPFVGRFAGESTKSPGFVKDGLRFLAEWLKNPVDVAAVAPSSEALANLITSGIDGATGQILELGPGTGSFTAKLIAHGVREEDLTLVELNRNFGDLLKRRFPRATLLRQDAASPPSATGKEFCRFDAAICGLGLRNMSHPQIEAILTAVFSQLRSGAPFFLFTYGFRCSVPDEILSKLNLAARRTGTTFRNIPPATVYHLSERNVASC